MSMQNIGTHHDNIGANIPETEAVALQQYIRERFIAVTDSEKIGLPKVMSSIEISCKYVDVDRQILAFIFIFVFQ